jgi:hypothetical protein
MKNFSGSVKEYMEVISNELFLQKTVYKEPDYIVSANWQRRRCLSITNGGKYKRNSDVVDDYFLPYMSYFKLGPYEKNLLYNFCNCKEGYLFLKGGSKSGKSSTLSYLNNICKGNYSNEVGKEDSPQLNIKIIQLDLSTYRKSEYENAEKVYNVPEETLTEFFSDLSESIVDGSRNFLDNETDYCSAFFDVFKKSYPPSPVGQNKFTLILNKIKRDDMFKYWVEHENNIDIDLKYEIINKLQKKQKHVCDIFYTAVAPLWHLANTDAPNKNSTKFILVIDNIDAFPPPFQQKVAEYIRQACLCPTYSELNNKNNFAIVVPVRLSTFNYRIGQNKGYNGVEHQSLYPSDVVSSRLRRFFISRGHGTHFTKIKNITTQIAVLLKFYSLYTHLSDVESYFRSMLDSVSGTNILHANQYADTWCINAPNPSIGASKYNIDNFYEKILRHTAKILINDFWISIVRSISFVVKEHNFNNVKDIEFEENSPDNYSNTAEIASNQLSLYIEEIYQYRDIVNNKIVGNIDDEKALSLFIKELSNVLGETKCTNMSYTNIHVNYLYSEMLKNIKFNKANTFLVKKIFNHNSAIKHFVFINMSDDLQDFSCQFSDWISSYLNNFNKIYLEDPSIFKKSEKAKLYTTIDKDSFLDDADNSYDVSLSKSAPKITRFEAGSILLSDNQKNDTNYASAEDVFFIEHTEPMPVGMHILYLLYNSNGHNMSLGKLIESLECYNYDFEKHILRVLKCFVKIKRRLIFSDVNDYNLTTENFLKDTSRKVYLSSTGKGYLFNLIATPPYLDWCFNGKNSNASLPYHDNMIGKIRHISEKLKIMIENEIKSFTDLDEGKRHFIVQPPGKYPNFYCASYDVLLRFIEYCIPGIAAHMKNVRDNKEKSREAREFLIKIYKYLVETMEQIPEKYNLGQYQKDDLTYINWNIYLNIIKTTANRDSQNLLGD